MYVIEYFNPSMGFYEVIDGFATEESAQKYVESHKGMQEVSIFKFREYIPENS